jgi:NAD(P)-dependent dehydrogenase (short-subunit alcohol dehydrogenase family)
LQPEYIKYIDSLNCGKVESASLTPTFNKKSTLQNPTLRTDIMSGTSKTVAFFGASGGVGLSALKHTLAAGHQCIALCRTPSKLTAIFPTDTTPNLKIIQGNAHDVASVSQCLQGANGKLVDIVISSIGARLGGDPYRVDPRVDLGLDRLVSVGVDSRVDA